VLEKPFLTTLSLPRFVVICGGRRLGLLAGKLSADSFCNPQNAVVERFACARAVVIGRMNDLPFLFDRHSNIPWSESIGSEQQGSSKQENRFVVWWRRNGCSRRFTASDTRIAPRGATSLQRYDLWKGSAPLPNEPCSHGKPLPGRRQPVKVASREAGARNAPALTGWRRPGLLASKQTRLSFRFTARAPACERTTSRLLHLAWRCRRCGGRYAVRARAATGRG
jgi:hypothetical protein